MEKNKESLLPQPPCAGGFAPTPQDFIPGEHCHHHHHDCPVPGHHRVPYPYHHCFRPHGHHGPLIPIGPHIEGTDEKNVNVGVNLFNTPGSVTVVKNYYTEKTQDEAEKEDQKPSDIAKEEEWPIEVLYHKKTGKPFYPKTAMKACVDDEGTSVETYIETIHERIDPSLIRVNLTYTTSGEPMLELLDDITQEWIDSIDKGIHYTNEADGIDKVIMVDRYTWDPETENFNWFFAADNYIIKIDMAAKAASIKNYEESEITVDEELSLISLNPVQNRIITAALNEKVKDVKVDGTSVVTNGVAEIDTSDFGKVKDIKVDGTSLVDADGIADLSSVGKVKDVKVDGTSVLGTDGVAAIDLSGKQNKLTTAQQAAVDSGIDATKVTKYEANTIDKANNKISLNGVDYALSVSKTGSVDGNIKNTITSVALEADGNIKVTYAPIEIEMSQISDAPDLDELVKKEDATLTGLEVTALVGGVGKTITNVNQVDGKISGTMVDIVVDEDHVTNLKTDLNKKVDEVTVGDNATKLTTTNGKIAIPKATTALYGVVKTDEAIASTDTNDTVPTSKAVYDAIKVTDDKIGALTSLTTTAKTTLVAAINELDAKSVDLDDSVTSTSANGVKSSGIFKEFEDVTKIVTGANKPTAGQIATFQSIGANLTTLKGTTIDTAIAHTTSTAPSTTNLPTSKAVYDLVDDMLGDLAGAMIFKGTVSSTTPLPTLPTPASDAAGWECVVAEAGTYDGKACNVGDFLIYNGTAWLRVSSSVPVTDKAATLTWDPATPTTIAEVNGTSLTAKLPAADTTFSTTSTNPVQNKVIEPYITWEKTTGKTAAAHTKDSGSVSTADYSTAEGKLTSATGVASHSEGLETRANGNYSHAEGYTTITNNVSEHAEGSFNLSTLSADADKGTIHTEGIGTSNSARKNACEVKLNGDRYIIGIGGFTGNNADPTSLVKNPDGTDFINPLTGETEKTIKPLQDVILLMQKRIDYLEGLVERLSEYINI